MELTRVRPVPAVGPVTTSKVCDSLSFVFPVVDRKYVQVCNVIIHVAGTTRPSRDIRWRLVYTIMHMPGVPFSMQNVQVRSSQSEITLDNVPAKDVSFRTVH